jgi:hypothetical protein
MDGYGERRVIHLLVQPVELITPRLLELTEASSTPQPASAEWSYFMRALPRNVSRERPGTRMWCAGSAHEQLQQPRHPHLGGEETTGDVARRVLPAVRKRQRVPGALTGPFGSHRRQPTPHFKAQVTLQSGPDDVNAPCRYGHENPHERNISAARRGYADCEQRCVRSAYHDPITEAPRGRTSGTLAR